LLASLAMAAMSTACVVDRPEPQAAIVQQRDDWPRFLEELPRNNYAAARALERYRRRHGLPQAFFVPDSVPPDQRRGLAVDEDEMCGKGLTAFVTWIPPHHRVLGVERVLEFDAQGKIVRQWPLPNGVGGFDILQGVTGDEIIVPYVSLPDANRREVYLRIRPDGQYRVTADGPPPPPIEEWILVADTGYYLRVKPKDDFPYTRGSAPPGTEPGEWKSLGDTAYVRVSEYGEPPIVRRPVRLPGSLGPRGIACPAGSVFEGMICKGFVDRGRERRIGYSIPCT
jgi:hypothetical protein